MSAWSAWLRLEGVVEFYKCLLTDLGSEQKKAFGLDEHERIPSGRVEDMEETLRGLVQLKPFEKGVLAKQALETSHMLVIMMEAATWEVRS